MSVSADQLAIMLTQLQQTQNAAAEKLQAITAAAAEAAALAMQQQQVAAQQAATAAQTALMEAMKTFLTESKSQPQSKPSTSDLTEKEKESNLDRKSDIKLNEKSYKRMNSYKGGDDEWEDWRYDFEIITRGVNPGVGSALTEISNSGRRLHQRSKQPSVAPCIKVSRTVRVADHVNRRRS